jgi:hypothetical protein
MPLVAGDREVVDLPIIDLDSGGIVTGVELGGDGQPGCGGCGADQVNDRFEAFQGPAPVRLCCLIRLCGEPQVKSGEVAGARLAQGCSGPPCVQADQVECGGGEDVGEACLGEAGIAAVADPGDGDCLVDGALDTLWVPKTPSTTVTCDFSVFDAEDLRRF